MCATILYCHDGATARIADRTTWFNRLTGVWGPAAIWRAKYQEITGDVTNGQLRSAVSKARSIHDAVAAAAVLN